MTLGQGAVSPFVFPFKLSQLQSEGIQRQVNKQPKPTLSESTTNPKSREKDDRQRVPCSRSVSVDGT